MTAVCLVVLRSGVSSRRWVSRSRRFSASAARQRRVVSDSKPRPLLRAADLYTKRSPTRLVRMRRLGWSGVPSTKSCSQNGPGGGAPTRLMEGPSEVRQTEARIRLSGVGYTKCRFPAGKPDAKRYVFRFSASPRKYSGSPRARSGTAGGTRQSFSSKLCRADSRSASSGSLSQGRRFSSDFLLSTRLLPRKDMHFCGTKKSPAQCARVLKAFQILDCRPDSKESNQSNQGATDGIAEAIGPYVVAVSR